MKNNFQYGQVNDSNEGQRFNEILAQCFNTTLEEADTYQNRIGIDNFRVLRKGKEMVGGLALYSMGQ